MYHYPFHLRDYLAKTKHLSPMEDLCYRRLLDAYYTREGALPRSIDECARLICLRDHVKEIELVLLEFFELTESGFFNARCEQELERYRARGVKAKNAADARWVRDTPDPDDKKPKRSPAASKLFPGADPEVLQDFINYRIRCKAPITPTAAKGILREAAKAELSINEALTMCVERSWRGFSASWVAKEKKGSGFDLEAEMRRAQ